MSDKGDKKPAGTVDPDLVRELAAILTDTGLSEIEVSHGDMKLRLTRTLTMAAPIAAPAHAVLAAPAAAPAALPAAAEAPRGDDARAHPGAVSSPMVGTAYLSPEPGANVFIKLGDQVAEGQTLLIVEAMKTFNPIPAPRAGKVTRILVSDGQPVEFGEPLVILE